MRTKTLFYFLKKMLCVYVLVIRLTVLPYNLNIKTIVFNYLILKKKLSKTCTFFKLVNNKQYNMNIRQYLSKTFSGVTWAPACSLIAQIYNSSMSVINSTIIISGLI